MGSPILTCGRLVLETKELATPSVRLKSLQTMRARVLFFGLLKDIAGRSSEDAEFPAGADLRAVFDSYAARFPRLRELASSVVIARNQEFSDLAVKVEDGDEIAF